MESEGWTPTCRLRIVHRTVTSRVWLPDDIQCWVEQAWERRFPDPDAHFKNHPGNAYTHPFIAPDIVETQWRTLEIVGSDGVPMLGSRVVK